MHNHDSMRRAKGRICGYGAVDPSHIRTATFLVFIVIFALGVSGCGGPDTIWQTEVGSPDGRWLASAKTEETSGFGTGLLETDVYMKWVKDSKDPENVLVLVHDGKSESKTLDLSLKWVTPSHLDVSYNGHARVDFQVVKLGDVDISLHDLSNMPNNNSQ
jgi:hypothetical protein